MSQRPFFSPQFFAGVSLGLTLAGVLLIVAFLAPSTPLYAQSSVIAVTSHGATCNDRGNDTSAINAAIAAFNKSPPGTILQFPAGTCRIDGALTPLTHDGFIRGTGPNSVISSSSATADIFSVTTDDPVNFLDLRLVSTAPTRTAGAGIRFSGSTPSSYNRSSRVGNVVFDGMYDAVVLYSTAGVRVVDCNIINSYHAGVLKYNNYNKATADTGDDIVSDSSFDNGGSNDPVAAIFQVSGGGLRISNNKILKHRYGYYMRLGTSTSDLIITGNSFEKQKESAIAFTRSGAAEFGNVVIASNQVAIVPTFLSVTGNAAWISNLSITGNAISTFATAITLDAGTDYTINGNTFVSSARGLNPGAAISLGATFPSRVMIGANQVNNYQGTVRSSGASEYSVSRP
jgi:hypothetical protein